jgi:hypothetical protein
MSKRILLISFLVLGFIFLASTAFAQALPPGYDEDEEVQTISVNKDAAGTTFIQDLEEIRRRRIDEIIEKIRQGDPNVLRFVVYDVFEEVHQEIIRRARVNQSNFYAVVNMSEAIPAYVGGFDNQDPKVRLRCIGWLGDWVDEIGTDLNDIQKRTRDRLVSRIETREEVKFALRLLDLKIVRKTTLNKVYNGDDKILESIKPEQFIALIHDELFLREVYCIPRRVHIRSIRLAPWWIDIYVLNAMVSQRIRLTRKLGLPDERLSRMYNCPDCDNTLGLFILADETGRDIMNEIREIEDKQEDELNKLAVLPPGYDEGYILKVLDDTLEKTEFEQLKTYYYNEDGELAYYYGYIDHAKRWDIQTLYDLRYFAYSETGDVFENEDKYVRALFAGLRNPSLVVRENCARILVMLSDPYVILDNAMKVIGVEGVIGDLARESKFVETALNAWYDVRFAQFVDVARPARIDDLANPDSRVFYHNDGLRINYQQTLTLVPGEHQYNPWGYCWNYRIDVHELLRRMGLGHVFDCDEEEVVTIEQEVVETENTYFVESLFDLSVLDLDEKDSSYYYYIPDWHGVDEIEDEIFNPGP